VYSHVTGVHQEHQWVSSTCYGLFYAATRIRGGLAVGGGLYTGLINRGRLRAGHPQHPHPPAGAATGCTPLAQLVHPSATGVAITATEHRQIRIASRIIVDIFLYLADVLYTKVKIDNKHKENNSSSVFIIIMSITITSKSY